MKKLIFVFFLLPFFAHAQSWNLIYGRYEHEKTREDSMLRPPLDTLASADVGSVAFKNDNQYQKQSDGYWHVSSVGRGIIHGTQGNLLYYAPDGSAYTTGIINDTTNSQYVVDKTIKATQSVATTTIWNAYKASAVGTATSSNPVYGGAYYSDGFSYLSGSKASSMRWGNKPSIQMGVQVNNLVIEGSTNGGAYGPGAIISDFNGGNISSASANITNIVANTLQTTTSAIFGTYINTSGIFLAYVEKTANYALSSTLDYVVNCTSNSFTLTLPAGTSPNYKLLNSGSGIITVTVSGGTESIYTLTGASATTFALGAGQWIELVGGVSSYKIVGGSPNNSAIQTLTDASTITWNAQLGINSQVTLGATGRTLSINNPIAGNYYTIRIIQDGTGSRTITTWPTNTKWPGGTAIILTTTAAHYDVVTFYYDGTNYYATYQNNFQ